MSAEYSKWNSSVSKSPGSNGLVASEMPFSLSANVRSPRMSFSWCSEKFQKTTTPYEKTNISAKFLASGARRLIGLRDARSSSPSLPRPMSRPRSSDPLLVIGCRSV